MGFILEKIFELNCMVVGSFANK